MRLAWGLEGPIGNYLSAHFPHLMRPGLEYRPDWAVGFVDEQGRLYGALGLCFDSPWDGQLSIYCERPRWASRAVLRQLLRLCFHERGLVRLTCHIRRDNRHARVFVERLGFRFEGMKRKAFDGVHDAAMYGLLEKDCWLLKDGKHAGA
jgi:RimJ/RimL family protein N-acetyltransferase